MKAIGKQLNQIKEMISNPDFISAHKQSSTDFTREVKLSFADIMTIVLSNAGSTLDLESYNFCKKQSKSVSPSAICQARGKIKYTAFESLLRETSKAMPVTHLYKGYRLTSYDGMQGELPRTPALMAKYRPSESAEYPMFHALAEYRPSESAEYPMFHALAEYDVLNCCYTNALFAPAPADERDLACQLLSTHTYEGAEIFLLDRGFPSVRMIQMLNASGKKYIMRVSSSFLREVNEFTKGKSDDKTITVKYDKRRKATSRVTFEGSEYEFTIRCVKIPLPKGKTEILITNLTNEEMTRSELGDIYNLRWRIETAFLDLKYAVHIEDFISKKEEFIKQEFYASLIQANLSMLFMEVANSVIRKSKKKKNWITQ